MRCFNGGNRHVSTIFRRCKIKCFKWFKNDGGGTDGCMGVPRLVVVLEDSDACFLSPGVVLGASFHNNGAL